MKILFVASEGLPYIKSGGLADVVGSLPSILNKKGMDVRVVLPMYLRIARKYREGMTKLSSFPVDSGDIHTVATIYSQKSDEGVTYYFVEHQGYFEREELYGYPDDAVRFAFFQRAVLEMLPRIDFWPDIMHCHDWHTGMIPALCKVQYAYMAEYARIKHIYTIHNLAFQGNYSADVLWSCFGLGDEYYRDGSMRMHGGTSYLKVGLIYADKVTTVSDTYAKEILTPEFGEQMQGVLEIRKGDLVGIVNGINLVEWDTKKDPKLAANYNKVNVFTGKKKNKLAVQKEVGLIEDESIMMLGMVSRLTNQKGVKLILDRMEEILSRKVQVVILGTGEKPLEEALVQMAKKHPTQMAYIQSYNDGLAHRIYAASDLFLMPSLFEPCGIGQLNAMHYGTLPLVRETGGLKDTVLPYNEYSHEGTGFSFKHFDSYEFYNTLLYAESIYYNEPKEWKSLVKQAMNSDVSWENSASKYLALYQSVVK